jgi:hypothetical protein
MGAGLSFGNVLVVALVGVAAPLAACAVLAGVDRDTMSHPHLRLKLEAVPLALLAARGVPAPVTAAALVTAGLVSVVLFPPLAVSAMQAATAPVPAPSHVAHRPMGTQH